MKEGYKDSVLGEIPVDWEVVKLGDACTGKGTYGINAAAVNYDNALPTYLRITDIDEAGRFIPDSKKSVQHKDTDSFYLEAGDIVFARTGNTTGKTYLYNPDDGKLVYAGFLIKFSPNSNVLNSSYLKHYTETQPYWDWVKVMSSRSGQPGINEKQYSELLFKLPPLPEQQKIASILSTADQKIEVIDQQIAETQQLKKGLMQKLLTKGIGHTKFKDSALGEIPVSWEVVKLGDVSKITMGQSPDGNSYNKEGNGLPVLNGPTEFTKKHPIPVQFTTNITKLAVKGDVLFCVRGSTTGRMNIADQEYCIGRGLASIKGSYNTDTSFLYAILQNLAEEILRKAKDMGSTFPNVNSKELSSHKIPLPPLPEQQKIASILSTVDDKLEVLQEKKAEFQALKKGLMQVLLTGKKRVCT